MPGELVPWEHGSEFALFTNERGGGPQLPAGGDLYGSGRDAIRAILRHGRNTIGWTTLWVPSYFCQTVLKDIQTPGILLRPYGDSPLDDESEPIELPSDGLGVVLTLNPFGLRTRNRPLDVDRARIWVIEDHTHDPWSPLVGKSQADFCVASLRKTIPIPDGGILWSPVGHPLPVCPGPTGIRLDASTQKLTGMALKSLFLSGIGNHKLLSRKLLASGEDEIARGEISGMPYATQSLMQGFNALEWRARRLQNFNVLASRLGQIPNVRVLLPTSNDAVPFCVVLQLPLAKIRNALRQRLIDSNVYPAILWSLEDPQITEVRTSDLALSRRMLTIHCDGRYSVNHMLQVAEIVEERMRQI